MWLVPPQPASPVSVRQCPAPLCRTRKHLCDIPASYADDGVSVLLFSFSVSGDLPPSLRASLWSLIFNIRVLAWETQFEVAWDRFDRWTILRAIEPPGLDAGGQPPRNDQDHLQHLGQFSRLVIVVASAARTPVGSFNGRARPWYRSD